MRILSWLFITPGIYTLAIALLAGVVPTLKYYEQKWVKITYGVFLGLLCCLEIASITHDRSEQDTKHRQELFTQQSQFQLTITELLIIKDDLGRVNGNLEMAKTQANKNSLKIATLQLSKEILQFVVEQDNKQPLFNLGTGALADAIFNFNIRVNDWRMAFRSEFHKLFDKRIADNLQKLKAQNIDVGLTGSLCMQQSDPVTGIRKCGVEIGKLGETLP